MSEELRYQVSGKEFIGKVFRPEGQGPFPGVMVAHDWSGINHFALESAKKIADSGYIAFAIDLYGDGKCFDTVEEKSAAMSVLKEDRALLKQRLEASFNALLSIDGIDPKKTAILGFCFGGLAALDLARSGANVRGAVSFHGLLDRPQLESSAEPTASVLVLHGYDDPMVKPDDLMKFQKEMTEAGIDWQVHAYGKTLHAFSNPEANDPSFGTQYSERASFRAWKNAFMFLEEVFHD